MKKNKIFQNKIDKQINNNQKVFDVKEEIKTDIENNIGNKKENLNVREKIDKLLNRNGYVFNVDVEIITDKKIYNTKIAGKVNNHLITLDNDIICINEIKDIVIK